ncbi:hypothetical protein AAFP30_24690 [Gordonia sp. CPCC 205515]|uniref:hypothetical protein n=1 Tax=Gordonia sp. CPCC 205515 TaxID=3140791 RepID=UPI003AF34AFD
MTTTERSDVTGARPLEPAVRRAAARMVLAADKRAGNPTDPRMVAIAEGSEGVVAAPRPLEPAARRAAARMVLAADKRAGKPVDPRMVAIAEGRE